MLDHDAVVAPARTRALLRCVQIGIAKVFLGKAYLSPVP